MKNTCGPNVKVRPSDARDTKASPRTSRKERSAIDTISRSLWRGPGATKLLSAARSLLARATAHTRRTRKPRTSRKERNAINMRPLGASAHICSQRLFPAAFGAAMAHRNCCLWPAASWRGHRQHAANKENQNQPRFLKQSVGITRNSPVIDNHKPFPRGVSPNSAPHGTEQLVSTRAFGDFVRGE